MEYAVVAAEHVREEYPGLLSTLSATAASTLDDISPLPDEQHSGTGRALRTSFRSALVNDRLLGRLPGVLASTVHEVGEALPERPVAAPPYVAITSEGVVLRANLDPGRLVVELCVFERTRDGHRLLEDGRVDAAFYPATGGAARTADRT